ncbi:DUF6042 family protein [Actinokineospora pegani]|uniref:DUF6042 family protein n=1 Tax=Actinokineospora pegani TaxID=2654637 RepID=UPI0012EA1C0B|nr:DUF6042 family protein [Actinokineospora pegani]
MTEETDGEALRGAAFREVFDGLGWNRFVPHAAIEVLGIVVMLDGPTREQIARLAGRCADAETGLATPAWDEFEPWTVESLASALDGGTPTPTPTEVDRANAEGRAWLDRSIAEVDRYATALGVPCPRTLDDVLDYLIACTVLLATTRRSGTHFEINPWAMLPAEVLPLTGEQTAEEDALRWIGLHRPVVRGLIALFGPYTDTPLDVVRASVATLARNLDVPRESARAAVAILAEQPDFAVDADPDRVPDTEEFDIRIDWANFIEYRLDIAAGTIESP